MHEIIKNYKDNNKLRYSFNELAKKTFCLDFEDWYQNGYWRENYIPYSVVQNENIIANVSVNITDMLWNGIKRNIIQLGTVMTEESFRTQGLIRRLMEEIENDYGQKVDGIYLFSNDSVLDVYPKFGYRKALEYQYSKQMTIDKPQTVLQVPMNDKKAWNLLENAINKNKSHGQFDMINNNELYMFYVTKFMQENVYYDEITNTYVIAEIEKDELILHNVFSNSDVELDAVIQAFGNSIRKVILGFVPNNKSGYTITELHEENTTLFVKGNVFEGFNKQQLMFPTLAHA